MAYSNYCYNTDIDLSTYDTGIIGGYPDLTLEPATEVTSIPTYGTLANFRDAIQYPGLMPDPVADHMVPENYNPVPLATLHFTQPGYLPQLSHTRDFPPEVPESTYASGFSPDIPTQPQPADLSGWGGSFAAGATSGVVPSGSSWENQSGLTVGTFYPDVPTSYQPSAGPIRTAPIHARRSHMYGPYHAHSANAEAGPSIWPPSIPPVDPPTVLPSGGQSEITADTEKANQKAEKTPKRIRAPRGTGKRRESREQMKDESPKLTRWAKRYRGLRSHPSLNVALAVAAEAIPLIREIVNEKPLLAAGRKPKGLGPGSEEAMKERKRREIEREWCQVLSQYYSLNKGKWKRAQLLSAVARDVETHPALQRTPSESELTPGVSTLTTPESQ